MILTYTTNLGVQVSYTGASTTSTSSPTSTSGVTTPQHPTQSGIDPACNLFAEAVSGDGCTDFAKAHDITASQLYDWNPVLGDGGAKCSTAFQAGYDYCVSVLLIALHRSLT